MERRFSPWLMKGLVGARFHFLPQFCRWPNITIVSSCTLNESRNALQSPGRDCHSPVSDCRVTQAGLDSSRVFDTL
jgi:hypothetical protein